MLISLRLVPMTQVEAKKKPLSKEPTSIWCTKKSPCIHHHSRNFLREQFIKRKTKGKNSNLVAARTIKRIGYSKKIERRQKINRLGASNL